MPGERCRGILCRRRRGRSFADLGHLRELGFGVHPKDFPQVTVGVLEAARVHKPEIAGVVGNSGTGRDSPFGEGIHLGPAVGAEGQNHFGGGGGIDDRF